MAYVLMDVGGTQIKAAACTGAAIVPPATAFDAKSGCGKREIFENFAGIIRSLLRELPGAEQKLTGVGMAFPGPFDYVNGISLMRGLHKYDAICGCAIRREVMELLPEQRADAVPFVFLHDVEAFAIGQSRSGASSGSSRAMFLCIGTGAGSAFAVNGAICKKQAEGVPENGWIYNTPFRDGVIDDYVSARGLRKISARFYTDVPDGEALAARCAQGDTKALAVFSEFGAAAAAAVGPFLCAFRPDTLVLGGQISKSFCYFGKALEKLCKESGIRITISADSAESSLRGLLSVLTQSDIGKKE